MTPDHPLQTVHPWKTQDPDWDQKQRKGMLLSDQIRRFCSQKPGLLIAKNYSEGRLRPAAYTLTIGDAYVDSQGERHELSSSNPSFEMAPNSIVFVSTAESLDLPYYIAARFNLRVEWVYKGILLGTGPQVEPGFRGYLSCPLYNLTNRPHVITRGEEFATIDFERTSDFVNKLPQEVVTNLESRNKLDVYKVDGREFLLFKQKELMPLEKYREKDYKVVSSLAAMQRDVSMWRKIGIGVIVSFIALTLSILGLQNYVLREAIDNAKDLTQLKNQLTSTQKELQRLQDSMSKNTAHK